MYCTVATVLAAFINTFNIALVAFNLLPKGIELGILTAFGKIGIISAFFLFNRAVLKQI
jgi:hypothetical protein